MDRIRAALDAVKRVTSMREELAKAKADVRSLAVMRASEKERRERETLQAQLAAAIAKIPTGPVIIGSKPVGGAGAAAPELNLSNLGEEFNMPSLSPSNAVNFVPAPAPAPNSDATRKRKRVINAAERLVTALEKKRYPQLAGRMRATATKLRRLTHKFPSPREAAHVNDLANRLSAEAKRGGRRNTKRRKYRKYRK